MPLEIQWALANLATKEDIRRVEETLLLRTEARLKALEDFRDDHIRERREHVRRAEDRRRQRVTWALGLVGPFIALLALAWGGLRTMLEAAHIVGPR